MSRIVWIAMNLALPHDWRGIIVFDAMTIPEDGDERTLVTERVKLVCRVLQLRCLQHITAVGPEGLGPYESGWLQEDNTVAGATEGWGAQRDRRMGIQPLDQPERDRYTPKDVLGELFHPAPPAPSQEKGSTGSKPPKKTQKGSQG